ncbi:MAG: cache domain-containing protein [Verrucomicrobia bacterium]|nr:cache domain-containing protein [Verrucomicrobiota bacterium]
MTEIVKSLAVVSLIWAALVAGFVCVVWWRGFARFEKGFLLMVMTALAGMALMAASVIGVWGYQASKAVVSHELVVELENVADIVDSQLAASEERVGQQLNAVGRTLAPLLRNKASAEQLAEPLRNLQRFDSRYLQVSVVGKDMRLLATTSVTGETEPVNRICAAFTAEGKEFVSDAYESAVFKKHIILIGVPVKDANGEILGGLKVRFDLQAMLTSYLKTVRFNQSGYAVLVSNDGHILAHPKAERINDDISSYAAIQQARQARGRGSVVQRNNEGVERLMIYRTIENPATVDPKPWILLAEINESEALALLQELYDEFALGLAVLIAASLLIAWRLSVSIKRPVHDLLATVQRVKSGDLTARTTVEGRDELGQLGVALNEMAKGLQERDRVKDVFGRYIATQVSEKILKGELNLGGEMRNVTILFSDIRNFTTMAEELAPQQVVAFLNNYFSEMVEAVFEQGGVLDKFMGDGMLAVFGSMGDQPDHPRRAVLAALRMKALLGKINGERSIAGKPPIAIGIGVHTDDVIVGNIGSNKRLEYTVIGDGVNTTSRVQTLNKQFGTTILITQPTYEAVKDAFECHLMPDTQLRGKTKTFSFYEVLSSKS